MIDRPKLILSVLLAILACLSHAHQAFAQAATTKADQTEQIKGLVAHITDPKTELQNRRTAAALLLTLDTGQATGELLTLLAESKDKLAILAVVQALAGRENADPQFKAPLINVLTGDDPAIRAAAALALGRYADRQLVGQLYDIVANANRPIDHRLAAIDTLGKIRRKPAVAALIRLLEDSPKDGAHAGRIGRACVAGLVDLTLVDYGEDIAEWQIWWKRNVVKHDIEWLEDLVDVMGDDNRDLKGRLSQTERALAGALVQLFRAGPKTDAGREKTIRDNLTAELAVNRRAGLKMLAVYLSDKKKQLTATLQPAVRKLLADADPVVRLGAARALREGSDRQAVDDILKQLNIENDPAAKRELLIALGQLGSPDILGTIIPHLRSPIDTVAVGAAQAIGAVFLNKRDNIPQAFRDQAVTAMVKRYKLVSKEPGELKQELLANMVHVADNRFSRIFTNELENADPGLRQSAARGIIALKDPEKVELLAKHIGDGDPSVRAVIARGIASLTTRKDVVMLLVGRLDPEVEMYKRVRQATFTAVKSITAQWPIAQQLTWADNLFDSSPWLDEKLQQDVIDAISDRIGKQETPAREVLKGLGDLVLRTSGLAEAIEHYRHAMRNARQTNEAAVDEIADDIAAGILKVAGGQIKPSDAAMFLNELPGMASSKQAEALTDRFIAALNRQAPGNAELTRQLIAGLSAEFQETLSDEYRKKLQALSGQTPATAPAK